MAVRQMNRLSIVFLLVLPASCTTRNRPMNEVVTNAKDSSIVRSDSTLILGEKFKAVFKTDGNLYVLDSRGDTISKERDLYHQFEFDDFNGDSLDDIRVHYATNLPTEDLLIFDSTGKIFRKVLDFSKYPEPKPVLGTNYYYSYHRSGCADANWDSDLFFIKNFKAIQIGNIAGRQCQNRDERDGIYISEISGDKSKLIATLPIDTIERWEGNKWGFIKAYWTKNYRRFASKNPF